MFGHVCSCLQSWSQIWYCDCKHDHTCLRRKTLREIHHMDLSKQESNKKIVLNAFYCRLNCAMKIHLMVNVRFYPFLMSCSSQVLGTKSMQDLCCWVTCINLSGHQWPTCFRPWDPDLKEKHYHSGVSQKHLTELPTSTI